MKILITGYKGFIGKNLFIYLKDKGYQVEGFDWADKVIPDIKTFDIVVHLGAISSTTERNINKLLNQNLDFSIKLFNLCNRSNIKFIYASSASVYGNAQKENNLKFIKEDHPKYPLNPYAWSKYLFDRWLINLENKKIDVIGLRLFNVYGSGEEHKGNQQSVFGKFQTQAKINKKIKLFEKSDKIFRDFIWVGDVCNIIEKMFKVNDFNILNLGTGIAPSFYDVAKEYSEIYNSSMEYVPIPKNIINQYQYYTCADTKKLISIIGKYKFRTIKEYIYNN